MTVWMSQNTYDNLNPEGIGKSLEDAKGWAEMMMSQAASNVEGENDEPVLGDVTRPAWDAIGAATNETELIKAWREFGMEFYNCRIFAVDV